MKLEYAVCTTSGVFEPMNEDNFYLNGYIKPLSRANRVMRGKTTRKTSLFAVCDGLGGEDYGEEVSYTAVSMLAGYAGTFSEKYLEYIEKVDKILEKKENEDQGERASTLAALSIIDGYAHIVNLGDSRIYLYRDGILEQLSEDHSEFQTMLRFGLLTTEDYYTSPHRNVLTRSLNSSGTVDSPYISEKIELQKGDLFLLCSDGFCGSVKILDIMALLNDKSRSLSSKCKKMVKTALDNGSKDNITVMLVCKMDEF